jgi:hypothetical protein
MQNVDVLGSSFSSCLGQREAPKSFQELSLAGIRTTKLNKTPKVKR